MVWHNQHLSIQLMSKIICRKCGSAMVLRTAASGRFAGQQFWGCSTYPNCSNIMSIKDVNVQSSRPSPTARPVSEPVQIGWRESFTRDHYDPGFFTLGAKPAFLSSFELGGEAVVKYGLSQTMMLSRRPSGIVATSYARQLSGIIQKLLTRGSLPLCTPRVEHALAQYKRLAKVLRQYNNSQDAVGWEWTGRRPASLADDIARAWSPRNPPSDETINFLTNVGYEGMFDSVLERTFLCEWVTSNLGASAMHWFSPQASLDKLLQSKGIEARGDRRIDFLFYHPLGRPLAIELDGKEHQEQKKSDAERDMLLNKAGIMTIRVPNSEIELGDGANLREVRKHALQALAHVDGFTDHSGAGSALLWATEAARFQFALSRALEIGHLDLSKRPWNVKVVSQSCPVQVIDAAALDFEEMLGALNTLFGQGNTVPKINISRGQPESDDIDFSVGIYSYESPLTVEHASCGEDILFCPPSLPVILSTSLPGRTERICLNDLELEDAEVPLTFFLQALFRKRRFRDYQCAAMLNVLRGKDTVTLLPTGAGKSLIYQLAGLLLPGVTLIIDPIIALIEDQIDGLESIGIDRAIGLHSNVGRHELKALQAAIEKGIYYFVFVAPERLQIPEFRETLSALREKHIVNLAVIDEAHCVSEWGHDFRPPYLKLASNIREICRSPDGNAPALLALTGTASRAVLRELLLELSIDIEDANALVRPHSFDRPELKFSISKVGRGEDKAPKIRGILHALPSYFGLQADAFYKPSGSLTRSGIVFTLHVGGSNGHNKIRKIIEDTVEAAVTTYSGKPPSGDDTKSWELQKRQNAKDFKSNKVPVLVATKAFGMGIDKPNIRWSLHTGIPMSLEAFYQEAGRVGRDKNDAYCNMIFHEFDPKLTDHMLSGSPALDIEELRTIHDKIPRQSQDDVSNALYFHLLAFSGKAKELAAIKRILEYAGEFERRRDFEIPFDNQEKERERAILRMVKTGLLDDYETHYGSRRYVANAREFDFAFSRDIVARYVSESQPGRLKQLRNRLDEIERSPAADQPYRLCEFMVDFTYEAIELSRRRKLYEIILLGRKHTDDTAIRNYLLDYLQEGLGYEKIRDLAEQEDFSFEDWIERIADMRSVRDAEDIRGDAIRLLEPYPTQPGLLLARSASEAMATKNAESTVRDALLSAISSARNNYAVSDSEINELCIRLMSFATVQCHQFRIPLISAMLNHHKEAKELFPSTFALLRAEASDWDDLSQLVLVAAECEALLESAVKTLHSGVERYSSIEKIIQGASYD